MNNLNSLILEGTVKGFWITNETAITIEVDNGVIADVYFMGALSDKVSKIIKNSQEVRIVGVLAPIPGNKDSNNFRIVAEHIDIKAGK